MNNKITRLNKWFLVVLSMSISLNSGCQATTAALNKKVPEKYVEVIQDDPNVDVESSLKKSGKEYVCKEIYAGKGSSENRRACFIKAPDESKYKELGVKLSELPEAILVDTSQNILIVGKVFLEAVIYGAIRL
jgi:hypothetical protein